MKKSYSALLYAFYHQAALITFTFVCLAINPACDLLNRKGIIDGSVFIVTAGRENIKLALVDIYFFEYNEKNISIINNINSQQIKRAKDLDYKVSLNQESVELQTKERLERNIKILNELLEAAPQYSREREHYTERLTEKQKEYREYRSEHKKIFDDHEILLSEADSWKTVLRRGAEYIEALGTPLLITKTDADGKFSAELPSKKEYIVIAISERLVFENEEQYFWMDKFSFKDGKKTSLFLSNDNLATIDHPNSITVLIDYRRQFLEELEKLKGLVEDTKKFGL